MKLDTGLDLVTGALSYSGSRIAERLLAGRRRVRTLTFHPDRPHQLRGRVEVLPYSFDDDATLVKSLEGVTTLYNTYWVRFDHGRVTFAEAISNSCALFDAAARAGVSRIVHVSIANPARQSPLPYYQGKAFVECALGESGVPHSIVRPTLVFGGERDVLVNNIAWVLRRMPVFMLPGDGNYRLQPVHVEDLARICQEQANVEGNAVVDAAGPETMSFNELVGAVRDATGTRCSILHVPPALMTQASRALGLLVGDVVLTRDEIRALLAGLLVSREAPLGEIAFSDWLADSGTGIGARYASELERHFAARANNGPARGRFAS